MNRSLAFGTLIAATLIASGLAFAQKSAGPEPAKKEMTQTACNSPAKTAPDNWQPPFGE